MPYREFAIKLSFFVRKFKSSCEDGLGKKVVDGDIVSDHEEEEEEDKRPEEEAI